MRFEELNWFDVENYLKDDDRLMLVLGACEQHGYLSLLTDSKIPLSLADAASKNSGVLVGPVLNFGASPYFLAYPGTISLRVSTLLDLAEDLVRSLYNQGFRRILILNGHGGNDPVRGRLYEIANQLPNLQLAWHAWWNSHAVESIAQEHELKPYHAGWFEAFSFCQVTDLPAGSKTPPHVSGLLGAEEARKVYGDGVFGGLYQVDDAIMQQLFNAALEDVTQLLKFNE